MHGGGALGAAVQTIAADRGYASADRQAKGSVGTLRRVVHLRAGRVGGLQSGGKRCVA